MHRPPSPDRPSLRPPFRLSLTHNHPPISFVHAAAHRAEVSRSLLSAPSTAAPIPKSPWPKPAFPIFNRKDGLCGSRLPLFCTFSTSVDSPVDKTAFIPAKEHSDPYESARSKRPLLDKALHFATFFCGLACGKIDSPWLQWPQAFGMPHLSLEHEVPTRLMTAEKPPKRPSTGAVADPAEPIPPAPAPDARASGAAQPVDYDCPRIAIYARPESPPLVIPVDDCLPIDEHLPQLMDSLAVRAFDLARDQGGRLPLEVFRELVGNFVHASFAGVVITILEGGNTVRFSDRGPGIPDKDAALRPGFTSADSRSKRFIRGVGSGLPVVRQALASLDGELEIEDNLGRGTVVTVHLHPDPNIPLAPAAVPSYNLSERQLKTLLLALELAPVGPTRIAQELGVSTSTAYRDLVFLEEAGFVASEESGHRSVTDVGLAYLDAVL